MSVVYNVIEDYAIRLRQCADEDHMIKEFRGRFDHRFQELCMMHLSFLIDIPWELFDYNTQHIQECTPKSTLRRLLAGSKVNPQPVRSDRIPPNVADNIISLIDQLDLDEVCSTEGIFRKAGHVFRKRQLHETIFQPNFDPTCYPWDGYTAHDFASALKSILTHLPSPLLTERLMPLFLRVASLYTPELVPSIGDSCPTDHSIVPSTCTTSNAMNNILLKSKQIKALRLLLQLLPDTNRHVLTRLLQLLNRVVRLQGKNRMNSTCLGTVFGPVLFTIDIISEGSGSSKNSKFLSKELHERFMRVANLIATILEEGTEIFRLPRALAEDIHINSTYLLNATPSSSVGCSDLRTTYSSVVIDERKLLPMGASRESLWCTPSNVQHEQDGSPPLLTGIRFATPTLSSPVPCVPGMSSPRCAFSSGFCPITNEHERVSPACLYSTQQNKESGEKHCDLTSVRKISSIGESSKLSYLEIPRRFPTPLCGSLSSVASHKSKDIDSFSPSPSPLQRRGSFTVSAPGIRNATTELEKSISIAALTTPPKIKMHQRRRFTELKFPSTINRAGQRRKLFSPCPVKFPPIRLLVTDRRAPHGGFDPTCS